MDEKTAVQLLRAVEKANPHLLSFLTSKPLENIMAAPASDAWYIDAICSGSLAACQEKEKRAKILDHFVKRVCIPLSSEQISQLERRLTRIVNRENVPKISDEDLCRLFRCACVVLDEESFSLHYLATALAHVIGEKEATELFRQGPALPRVHVTAAAAVDVNADKFDKSNLDSIL